MPAANEVPRCVTPAALASLASLLLAEPIAEPAAFQEPTPTADGLAHETLPANDGWGSFSTGMTGGSAATAA